MVWVPAAESRQRTIHLCTVCVNAFLHVQLRLVRRDIELAGPEEIANVGVVIDSSDR